MKISEFRIQLPPWPPEPKKFEKAIWRSEQKLVFRSLLLAPLAGSNFEQTEKKTNGSSFLDLRSEFKNISVNVYQ